MNKAPPPKDLQIVGLVLAVMLTAIFVENGGTIDGAAWLFIKSLPVCALGLIIYKLLVKEEFQKPSNWPEWILLYLIGMLIGGPLVALGVHLHERFLS